MKEGKYADSLQDSSHSNFSYARYAEKFFTQIYRDLYGKAARNQQTSVTEFCHKSENLSLEEL